jgi:hypothetical protein
MKKMLLTLTFSILTTGMFSQSKVTINNIELSQKQMEKLEQVYGVQPKTGDYWYDATSGLYGAIGHASFGFMYHGHEFGTLQRNASNGNTNVIVNGRELPKNEWLVWSYVLGYYIQPGNYWFDHLGNAGNVGNPIPTVNLYLAAQQNGYAGRGSGGDNFWSTRFSAGNYDRGNTRGYVSVPGYGPVGYGF